MGLRTGVVCEAVTTFRVVYAAKGFLSLRV